MLMKGATRGYALLALCGAGIGGIGGIAGRLTAQSLRPAVGGLAMTVRMRSEAGPGATDALTGTAVGGEGRLVLNRWQLGVTYLEGTLDPKSGSAAARDIVEGGALLGFRAAVWLTLRTGLQTRAYVLTGGGTQRWVFWTLGARAVRPFVGSAVDGYVELWRAVSADVNAPQPLDHVQGGEVGMVARLSRTPLDLRLAYRIDHAVLGGGARRETVDGLLLALVLSRR